MSKRHPDIRVPAALDAMTIAYVEEWADIVGLSREQALGDLVKMAIAQCHPDLKEVAAEQAEADSLLDFPEIAFGPPDGTN